jgi:hypothetical protein
MYMLQRSAFASVPLAFPHVCSMRSMLGGLFPVVVLGTPGIRQGGFFFFCSLACGGVFDEPALSVCLTGPPERVPTISC